MITETTITETTAAVLQETGLASLGPDTWTIIAVIVAVAGIFVTMSIATRRESREAHANIGKRIDSVEERIDGRIAGVEERVAGFEERIDGRIAGVDRRIDEVKNELAATNAAMAEFRGVTEARIQHLQETTDGLNARMDGMNARMDGMNARMDGLDARTAKLTGAIEVITHIATGISK